MGNGSCGSEAAPSTFICSAVSDSSRACTLSSNCSSVRAPMMVDDTPGCERTQARATRGTVVPSSLARRASTSTIS